MKLSSIFETYSDYENTRWVHYSNHEMLTVNTKQVHQDPAGIYFFPEGHNPESSLWRQKKYKYTAVLKPSARVLDFPEISDEELNKMIDRMGVTAEYQAKLAQWPPDTRKRKLHQAWESMRMQFKFSVWNKVIRSLGYDAIFDDTGTIHSSEPIQLVVLNPRAISIVGKEVSKNDYFKKFMMIFNEMKELGETFGNVTTETPKIVTRYGQKTLTAYVRINDYDHPPYATITLTKNNDKNFSHLVSISVMSSPSLRYSLGAKYNTFKDAWEGGLGGKNELDHLKSGLTKIFTADENTPRDNYGGI